MRSSLLVFLLFFLSLNAQAGDFEIYLFVYSSAQTHSGAGHISIAFGDDTSHLMYYTKYRRADGGGFKVTVIQYTNAFNYDRDVLKHQKQNPMLVLKLKAQKPSISKLENLSDYWNIKKGWSLFTNNCTDAIKKLLRVTKINSGYAFLISTPNELVEDLVYHSRAQFDEHSLQVVYGDLEKYLKEEPNAVPRVLFRRKKQ